MTRRVSASLPLPLGGVTVFVLAAGVPLAVLAHTPGQIAFLVLMVLFAAVGVLVARRQPGNAIGWILIALALCSAVGLAGGFYALRAYQIDHVALPLSRLAVALAPLSWLSIFALLPLAVFLFPDGRVPVGRWRWALWCYVCVGTAIVVGVAVETGRAFSDRTIAIDSNGQLASLGGSQQGVLADAVNALGLFAYAPFLVAAIARPLLRCRRSSGVERQQLKWLIGGGTLAVIGVLGMVVPSNSSIWSYLVVGLFALPLCMGVAILRYHLYEIDRLISRTISYALLTTALAGVFIGLVVLLTDVLPFSSPVAVAASTLAAAALFAPLRGRLQQLIDRHFNRTHYDAQATVAEFTEHLRNAIDIDSISGELVGTVEHTIAPKHATVWIRPPSTAGSDPVADRFGRNGTGKEERVSLGGSSARRNLSTLG
jgi:hypothetical protein